MSHRLFDGITNSPLLIVNNDARSEARKHRDYLEVRLRNEIESDGKDLVSDDDTIAFSRHGSAYLRQQVGEVDEYDIYIALNGRGLAYGTTALCGPLTRNNRNEKSFPFPLTGEWLRRWITSMVRKIALADNVVPTKRGMFALARCHRSPTLTGNFLRGLNRVCWVAV